MKVFKWIVIGIVGFIVLGIVLFGVIAGSGTSTPAPTVTPMPTSTPAPTPTIDPLYQEMLQKEWELQVMLSDLEVEGTKIDELAALCPSYMWEIVNYHVDEFKTLAGRETYKLEASASLDERLAVVEKVLAGAVSTRMSLEKLCLN